MQPLYYIAASPLVKIFLPEWEERLEENPDLVFDVTTPFEFDVDTGSRCIRVKFNTPQTPPGSRYDEQVNVFNFLTGGITGANSRATDLYGIVHFNPNIDMVSAMDSMAMMDEMLSEDPKVQLAIQKKRMAEQKAMVEKIKTTRAQVIKRSQDRILRHARMNHNNLIAQWQRNEENKMGKYPPSFTELMGSFVLRPEIEKSENKQAKIKAKMNSIMQNQVV